MELVLEGGEHTILTILETRESLQARGVDGAKRLSRGCHCRRHIVGLKYIGLIVASGGGNTITTELVARGQVCSTSQEPQVFSQGQNREIQERARVGEDKYQQL